MKGEQILYMCPFLRHFENGWPAEGLMRHRLERFRIKPPDDRLAQKRHSEPRKMRTRARKVEEQGSDKEYVPVNNPVVLKQRTPPPERASLARSMTVADYVSGLAPYLAAPDDSCTVTEPFRYARNSAVPFGTHAGPLTPHV